MIQLLPVIFSTVFLGFFSHVFSTYDTQLQTYTKRNTLLWGILFCILVIFAGTRYNYNDTLVYIGVYEDDVVPLSLESLKQINYSLGENPGFYVFLQLLKLFRFTSQSFIFLTSIITVGLFMWFIRKYTTDLFMSVYLFVIFGGYDFMLAGIKQSIAMAFSAVAVDRIINNKKVSFVLWIALASTFHPYALMYLICPFLFFKPWTKRTWYLLGVFAVFGLSFQFVLPQIVDITTLMGETYTIESFSMGGVNPLRAAVCCVSIFLSYIVRNQINDTYFDRTNNIIINLAMLNGELMFVGMFGASLYTGRLANYFILFQLLAIPYLLKFINPRYKSVIYVSALVMFFLYSIYGNVYAHGIDQSFDRLYHRYKLFEYLEQGIFVKK